MPGATSSDALVTSSFLQIPVVTSKHGWINFDDENCPSSAARTDESAPAARCLNMRSTPPTANHVRQVLVVLMTQLSHDVWFWVSRHVLLWKQRLSCIERRAKHALSIEPLKPLKPLATKGCCKRTWRSPRSPKTDSGDYRGQILMTATLAMAMKVLCLRIRKSSTGDSRARPSPAPTSAMPLCPSKGSMSNL